MSLIQFIAIVSYFGLLMFTFKRVYISRLFTERKNQYILIGSAVSLFGLWCFRTGIYDGLIVHFLWLSACLLLLGLRGAIVSSFLALLGLTAVGLESWTDLGINGLLGIVAPLTLSYIVYSLTFHRLPRNIFIYIFICGFLGAMAGLTLKMGLLGSYYSLSGIHEWQTVKDNYLVLLPLLLFMEGLLNGMTVTLLIVYKPKWVYTFHNKYYLQGK